MGWGFCGPEAPSPKNTTIKKREGAIDMAIDAESNAESVKESQPRGFEVRRVFVSGLKNT